MTNDKVPATFHPGTANDCPECRQGKHTICVEWSMDDADNIVPCPCSLRSHIMVSEVGYRLDPDLPAPDLDPGQHFG